MPDAADVFLAEVKLTDPERYAEVAERYPVISSRARRRDRCGHTYQPTDKRDPLSDAARQRYRDQRMDRRAYLRDWRIDYALAQEQAELGY